MLFSALHHALILIMLSIQGGGVALAVETITINKELWFQAFRSLKVGVFVVEVIVIFFIEIFF